jgi:ATP-dependent helicase HrpB
LNLHSPGKNPELPIDVRIPQLLQALEETRVLIVEAEPGAGKTTRFPPALLSAPWCTGRVLVTEPRKIAARLSATRVAQEEGSRLGAKVGYQVRFEDQTSAETQLIYLSEGLLLRQLLDRPHLPGVSVVVLDEAHERSSDLDVLLALLKKTLSDRDDLRVVIMSATLDAQAWQNYLPGAQHFECSGRVYPVVRHYEKQGDDRPLCIRVRSAVRSVREEPGDILVFLPGAREIRDCLSALEDWGDLDTLALHGDLPLKEQVRAVSGGQGKKRVILSTNLAESSLTIPGVTTVIDSGLARQKVFDPFSGVGRLETTVISQARCEQRAGRAGRIEEGRVLRLFTVGDFQRRSAQDIPEILREDLTQILLMLLDARLHPHDLSWLSTPTAQDWKKASSCLVTLGALEDNATQLSKVGKMMARLPLPPRCARLFVETQERGLGRRGAIAAALLAEREILQSSRASMGNMVHSTTRTDSDLEDRIELFLQLREGRFNPRLARDLGLDLHGAKQVDRIAASLISRTPNRSEEGLYGKEAESSLRSCLLKAFPDWVAATKGSTRGLLLSTGVQATLSEQSGVSDVPFLLALSLDAPGGKRTHPLVRMACSVSPDWLLEEAMDQVQAKDELRWNPDKERVEEISELRYGKLTLDFEQREARPSAECGKLLTEHVLSRGPAVFDPNGRLARLFLRLELLLKYRPDLAAEFTDQKSAVKIDRSSMFRKAVEMAAEHSVRLSQIRSEDLSSHLFAALTEGQRSALHHQVPENISLKGGRTLTVNYDEGRDPWIESRLQDFFSMTETPCILQGQLPLSLHLLAPNYRAVQVTSDLQGFWSRHYPDLRRQLMRRYPRHLWPEDGSSAKPPTPGKIR